MKNGYKWAIMTFDPDDGTMEFDHWVNNKEPVLFTTKCEAQEHIDTLGELASIGHVMYPVKIRTASGRNGSASSAGNKTHTRPTRHDAIGAVRRRRASGSTRSPL